MSNYIRNPLSGKVLAHLDGNYVRNESDEVLVSIDGNYIRQGASGGLVIASLDGDYIREGVAGGSVIGHTAGVHGGYLGRNNICNSFSLTCREKLLT